MIQNDLHCVKSWYSYYFACLEDDGNETSIFIVILECDAFEVLIRRLQTMQHQMQILFLDFFVCQLVEAQTDGVFRLETFRFKACYWFILPFIDVNHQIYVPGRCTFDGYSIRSATMAWHQHLLCSTEQHHKKSFPIQYFVTRMNMSTLNSDLMKVFFSFCRNDNDPSENPPTFPSNKKAEENYARNLLNGKHLRVTALEVFYGTLNFIWFFNLEQFWVDCAQSDFRSFTRRWFDHRIPRLLLRVFPRPGSIFQFHVISAE